MGCEEWDAKNGMRGPASLQGLEPPKPVRSRLGDLFAQTAEFDQEPGLVASEAAAGERQLQLLKDGAGFAGEAREDGSDVFHNALDYRAWGQTYDVRCLK